MWFLSVPCRERVFSTITGKFGASNECVDFDFIKVSLPPSAKNCYVDFAMVSGGDESNFDSGIGNDGEGDDGDISNVEDDEVRMDLTDDLLHMVSHVGKVVLSFSHSFK